MKIVKGLATFFSMAFQPVFMPLFTMVIMLLTNRVLVDEMAYETRWTIIIYCAVFTILIPMILFLLFYTMGWVSDVNLTKREERVIPTFLVMISFFVFYYLVREMRGVKIEFVYATFGAIIGPFIANFITMVWKISIHSLGVASAFASFYALSMVLETNQMITSILLFALMIIVGVSRLILKRHTPMQVICGASLGLVCCLGSVFYGVMV